MDPVYFLQYIITSFFRLGPFSQILDHCHPLSNLDLGRPVLELEPLGSLEDEDDGGAEVEVPELRPLGLGHAPLGEDPLAEVEVAPGAGGGHGTFPLERDGLVCPEVRLEVGVDGAHVGGAHGRHGKEAVLPVTHPGHALIHVEQAGEGGDHAGFDTHQLAGEVSGEKRRQIILFFKCGILLASSSG